MEKISGIIREACVDSLENALKAQYAGAERIELCSHLELDGLTPDLPLLDAVMSQLSIPVHAMARSRPGNFVYSAKEIEEIRKDIDRLRRAGVTGVVIGMLDQEGRVDVDNTRSLAAFAAPLKVTFHKAIDETPDILQALRQLMNIPGITGVLTSGGKPTATGGAAVLREMVQLAGDQLEIIAAGKITRANLPDLHQRIGARAYHGKRIVFS